MEMLISSRLCGVSLDARDNRGRSATEAFEDRMFPPDLRVRMVFDRLLERASRQADVWHAGDDEDEEEKTICRRFRSLSP